MQALAAAEGKSGRESGHSSLSLLAAVAKSGREELLGLPHRPPVAPQPPKVSLESLDSRHDTAYCAFRIQAWHCAYTADCLLRLGPAALCLQASMEGSESHGRPIAGVWAC